MIRLHVSLALALTLVATTVHAQPADARKRYAQATEHYAAGRYDQALVELDAAYAASPEPEYLFAIAQVHRLKNDCARAIPAYGAYLRTGPAPEATKVAQKMIDQCVAAGGTFGTQQPAPTPAPAPAASAAAPAEPLVIREVQRVHTRDVTLPWYRDTWGNVLAGSGVAALLVGTVALVRANSHDDRATQTGGYGEFDAAIADRDRAELVGGVALVAGGALVVSGLLHYALRPKRVKTEVRIDPGTGEASVSLRWPAF